jgi:hypothetical protein
VASPVDGHFYQSMLPRQVGLLLPFGGPNTGSISSGFLYIQVSHSLTHHVPEASPVRRGLLSGIPDHPPC